MGRDDETITQRETFGHGPRRPGWRHDMEIRFARFHSGFVNVNVNGRACGPTRVGARAREACTFACMSAARHIRRVSVNVREFRVRMGLTGSVTRCASRPYHLYRGVVVAGVGDYIGGSAVSARRLTVPHCI